VYLSYEQVAVDGTVKDVSDLTIPANATHAELQVDTQNMRYTLDGTIVPTGVVGFVMLTTEPPLLFLVEDLRNIQFTQTAAGAANLNIHYVAGRDI
jgi:hypothetical protein